MTPIAREKTEFGRLQALASEMTTNEYEFSSKWIRQHGWNVVPVEDGNHFAPQDIAALVPALRKAGYSECFAVATEPLGDFPVCSCYRVSITEEDLRRFNEECGLFRFILMDGASSWAVSCNELYNLFGAPPELLEAMLGQSIERARQEYLDFALLLSEPDGPLLQVARRYAEL